MSTYGNSSSKPSVAVLPPLRTRPRWPFLARLRAVPGSALHMIVAYRARASMRGIAWASVSGPALTLVLAVASILMGQHGFQLFHPMMLLLMAVICTICLGGLRAGLVSVLIAVLCDGYYIFGGVDALGAVVGDEVVFALMVPACFLLVAGLRRQAEETWAERERRLSEQAAAESLRQSQGQMDDALSLTSHELRTPLASIKISAQQCQRTLRKVQARRATHPDLTQPGEQQSSADESFDPALCTSLESALDYLARVDANVRRLDRMIGDLLDASRVRSDHLTLDPVPCDLVTVVTDVVAEQRTLFPTREVSVQTPTLPVLVEADALRVAQVVENYLSNAVKYTPADQPIEVALRIDGSAARITVRDHGAGIPPELRERIWRRFERGGERSASGTWSSPTGGGLGLGLYLCRGLIERSGGTVGVESSERAEDHGSTFWLKLPLLCA